MRERPLEGEVVGPKERTEYAQLLGYLQKNKNINVETINKESKNKIYKKLIKSCRRCEGSPVEPNLVINPKVSFILFKAGRKESESGESVSNSSSWGRWFLKYLEILELDISEVNVVYLNYCPTESSNCQIYYGLSLYLALETETIFLVGEKVSQRILNQALPISALVGNVFTSSKHRFIPVFHSSYIIRDKNSREVLYTVLRQSRERYL